MLLESKIQRQDNLISILKVQLAQAENQMEQIKSDDKEGSDLLKRLEAFFSRNQDCRQTVIERLKPVEVNNVFRRIEIESDDTPENIDEVRVTLETPVPDETPKITDIAVAKKTTTSKSSDCWYTPPEVIAPVLGVLEKIDLDPGSDSKKHLLAEKH
ncbi:MAG: hypothetical protein F6K40_06085 [Okeania sp. SIO3I5]|uniref:hypothetical protein n=1 Tax=Okeania sp. SIO3I5 TaxID=2607805 RepID=UPI0013BA74F3|nr:hypothetical protein [Okeania sp. SIO3I5]NEQ35877.1 hypothetical protein [Okeania sp. SIO3I5]